MPLLDCWLGEVECSDSVRAMKSRSRWLVLGVSEERRREADEAREGKETAEPVEAESGGEREGEGEEL